MCWSLHGYIYIYVCVNINYCIDNNDVKWAYQIIGNSTVNEPVQTNNKVISRLRITGAIWEEIHRWLRDSPGKDQ